ncbi:hypothetical protein PITCH_A240027 [uncultured Desulfobacterium sp.]|uniref:Uncharacterized protein n=1 Tax=uncultured Desulfobacterium sp. TaxID=201089 RepID=A0A445MYJ9_9BACT|nr:hypothetical protein PITCH_A240027 [uncultured Desulfobacterium sp.]
MLKSIKDTGKLFQIEGLRNGKVNIKATTYLLSLPEKQQAEVLAAHLEHLKKDLEKYHNTKRSSYNKNNEVEMVQVKLLIEVIEGLMAQV